MWNPYSHYCTRCIFASSATTVFYGTFSAGLKLSPESASVPELRVRQHRNRLGGLVSYGEVNLDDVKSLFAPE